MAKSTREVKSTASSTSETAQPPNRQLSLKSLKEAAASTASAKTSASSLTEKADSMKKVDINTSKNTTKKSSIKENESNKFAKAVVEEEVKGQELDHSELPTIISQPPTAADEQVAKSDVENALDSLQSDRNDETRFLVASGIYRLSLLEYERGNDVQAWEYAKQAETFTVNNPLATEEGKELTELINELQEVDKVSSRAKEVESSEATAIQRDKEAGVEHDGDCIESIDNFITKKLKKGHVAAKVNQFEAIIQSKSADSQPGTPDVRKSRSSSLIASTAALPTAPINKIETTKRDAHRLSVIEEKKSQEELVAKQESVSKIPKSPYAAKPTLSRLPSKAAIKSPSKLVPSQLKNPTPLSPRSPTKTLPNYMATTQRQQDLFAIRETENSGLIRELNQAKLKYRNELAEKIRLEKVLQRLKNDHDTAIEDLAKYKDSTRVNPFGNTFVQSDLAHQDAKKMAQRNIDNTFKQKYETEKALRAQMEEEHKKILHDMKVSMQTPQLKATPFQETIKRHMNLVSNLRKEKRQVETELEKLQQILLETQHKLEEETSITEKLRRDLDASQIQLSESKSHREELENVQTDRLHSLDNTTKEHILIIESQRKEILALQHELTKFKARINSPFAPTLTTTSALNSTEEKALSPKTNVAAKTASSGLSPNIAAIDVANEEKTEEKKKKPTIATKENQTKILNSSSEPAEEQNPNQEVETKSSSDLNAPTISIAEEKEPDYGALESRSAIEEREEDEELRKGQFFDTPTPKTVKSRRVSTQSTSDGPSRSQRSKDESQEAAIDAVEQLLSPKARTINPLTPPLPPIAMKK